MVAVLSHIHHIVTVNTDAGGEPQFSITFIFLPKLPQILSLCREHQNAVIVTVSYIHIPGAIARHIPGAHELSIATAKAAKSARECQVRVQNLNTVIEVVCYEHFVVEWVDGNTSWIIKLQRLISCLAYSCDELSG